MEVSSQVQLRFHGVDFPVINLNSQTPFKKSNGSQVELDIKAKVFFPKEHPKFFKIIQEVTVSSNGFFELFIMAVGTFEVDEEIDDKAKKGFVSTNAPAIMFPYVRSFVSTLTSNLGNVTGTLTIPTQFFQGELEEMETPPQE